MVYIQEPWFLPFRVMDPGHPDYRDGRPWADGTAMAARAYAGQPPWDSDCRVETYVSSYDAMTAIRDTLEAVITGAAAQPPANRGHVYLAAWRFNAQRDLSDQNSWRTEDWETRKHVLKHDQTALGLLLRLMQAGVKVRLLLWLPTTIESSGPGPAHIEDHYYVAKVIAEECHRLADRTRGIVALDARTADRSLGSHHQKTIVVRSGNTHVAFCGGVDLAFTRRDTPDSIPTPPAQVPVSFHEGDWQSAVGVPRSDDQPPWPTEVGVNYESVTAVGAKKHRQQQDLPTAPYGGARQIWHDQHLKLTGPIVKTLEEQFCERWVDTAKVSDLSSPGRFFDGQVIFSTALAYNAHGAILPLNNPAPVPPLQPPATSAVQMWRTIPWRDSRTEPPFRRAEFTVMNGLAHAVERAQKLIWIFDQYFWSLPLARQINARLKAVPGLHVLVVLPPFADTVPGVQHRGRKYALDALTDGVADRVGVYNLWAPERAASPGRPARARRGIYCHAKVQMFDDRLLVCGSANLNRRSFTCDSELACAVADQAVVSLHQQNLWTLLFGDCTPARAWPANWATGAKFFEEFTEAAKTPGACVIKDPWGNPTPTLPDGSTRTLWPRGPAYQIVFRKICDPSSISSSSEDDDPPLDRVVKRVELSWQTRSGAWKGPWRYQGS